MRAERVGIAFGLNAVPVVGVAWAGWTNATALVSLLVNKSYF